MARQAQERLNADDLAWGFRLLGWALHYIQDLTQPFHVVQLPRLSLVPWGILLSWKPKEAFQKLIHETTRTIGNYHFAFERYQRHIFEQHPEVVEACLKTPSRYTPLALAAEDTPEAYALKVADRSRTISIDLGGAFQDFFGEELMEPEYDLAWNKGDLDYALLFQSPEKQAARERVHDFFCESIQTFSVASGQLTQWILSARSGQ
jgi:hypothetical protein